MSETSQKLYKERKARNEEIDLADCLQICDKRDLILKLVGYGELGFESKGKAERLFEDAENLRNRLAHSQDLVLGTSWAEVIDLAASLDRFLQGFPPLGKLDGDKLAFLVANVAEIKMR